MRQAAPGNDPLPLDEHSCPALARGVRLKSDPRTGEPILLFPEGVLHLSETASSIVSRCDGRLTVAGLLASLAEDFEAPPEVLRQDVLDCLLELHRRKLMVW
jgi:coenzyme PQQ biosynthesis protein PqqD